MYKLLLVDDRKDVVDGIAKAISWEDYNISVQTCYNGKTALELIKAEQIDVVVTDIKMPFLSGLDLVNACKENEIDTCFIILSGYDDFSYAKQAIKLGVVEYLLKPVDMNMLLETVTKAIVGIEKKNELKKNMKRLQKQEMHSILALKKVFFQKMISESPYSPEEVSSYLELFNADINFDSFITILVSIDQCKHIIEAYGEKEMENMIFIVNNVAQEFFSEDYKCETFNYQGNKLAVVINIDRTVNNLENKYNIYLLSKRIHDAINHYFDFTITITISDCYEGIGLFKKSVDECLDTLSYRLYKGENKIILSSDIHKTKNNEGYPQAEEDKLINTIMLKDHELSVNIINDIFDKIIDIQEFSPEFIWRKMYNMIVNVYQAAEGDYHIIDVLDEFRTLTTLEQMKEWFIEQISKLIKPKMTDYHDIERHIDVIKAYLNKNYAQNITLKEIAESLYISQSYLSSVFKEYTGINFNNYLRDIRIEKAKELLVSGAKVYDVAKEVGYTDQKYFSTIFRKSTGYLPKQWAKHNAKNKGNI